MFQLQTYIKTHPAMMFKIGHRLFFVEYSLIGVQHVDQVCPNAVLSFSK